MNFKVEKLPLELENAPQEVIKFLNIDWELIQNDVLTTSLSINNKIYSVDIVAFRKKKKKNITYKWRVNL